MPITILGARFLAGIFRDEPMKARAIRDGRATGPMLPVLYEFPDDIIKSGAWRDPANWAMVTPNRDRSVTIARLGPAAAGPAAAAQASVSAAAIFAESTDYVLRGGLALIHPGETIIPAARGSGPFTGAGMGAQVHAPVSINVSAVKRGAHLGLRGGGRAAT